MLTVEPEIMERLEALAAVHTAGDVGAMARLLLLRETHPRAFEAEVRELAEESTSA